MILLDTNVLSEMMRPRPDPRVVTWIAARAADQLGTTAVCEAEILHGIELLPRGRRKDAIASAAMAMFGQDLAGRVLPFDSRAAGHYAQICAVRRKSGRPISQFDAQIAAIARSVQAAVATRNVADYQGCGVEVIDPWQPASAFVAGAGNRKGR